MYSLSCLPCLYSSYIYILFWPPTQSYILFWLSSYYSFLLHSCTDYYQTPPTTPTTMFRQVCLLAVAFLAVADAVNNEPKSIKDSKSVGSSNKKTKATTFCADVRTSFDVDKMSAMKGGRMSTLSQGFLFDCDKKVRCCWSFFLVLFCSFS